MISGVAVSKKVWFYEFCWYDFGFGRYSFGFSRCSWRCGWFQGFLWRFGCMRHNFCHRAAKKRNALFKPQHHCIARPVVKHHLHGHFQHVDQTSDNKIFGRLACRQRRFPVYCEYLEKSFDSMINYYTP